MKILPALFFLSISFTPFLASQALANDGPYEVLVVGYNYDTFMANLGGRAGYEYLKAMSQSSNNSSVNSSSSTSSSVANERQKCLANADAARKTCEGAYNTINIVCVGLTGYYGNIAAEKFFTQLGLTLTGDLRVLITTGAAAYNTTSQSMSCNGLTSLAMQYCAAGATRMKNSCPQ